MNDLERIEEIKKLFTIYHSGEDEKGNPVYWDTVDFCMKIEEIINK